MCAKRCVVDQGVVGKCRIDERTAYQNGKTLTRARCGPSAVSCSGGASARAVGIREKPPWGAGCHAQPMPALVPACEKQKKRNLHLCLRVDSTNTYFFGMVCHASAPAVVVQKAALGAGCHAQQMPSLVPACEKQIN